MRLMKKVSIMLNLYLPKIFLLDKVLSMIAIQKTDYGIELIIVDKKIENDSKSFLKEFEKKQIRNIKIKTIKVNENISFASSMNAGIKKCKNEVVVVLQQDCIPTSENWLQNLISPFEDNNVVATVSRVQFPEELWNKLSSFAKAIMIREKGIITPLLDEKACAYRMSAMRKVNFFNDKDFQTAGEDFDLYIKLKECGKIDYPDAEVVHYHPTDFKSRMKKINQYSNGFGTLVRIYGRRIPRWYFGFLKAIPIFGIIPFLFSYKITKEPKLYPIYIILTPAMHYFYITGFWKGFISGRQNVDVFLKN